MWESVEAEEVEMEADTVEAEDIEEHTQGILHSAQKELT